MGISSALGSQALVPAGFGFRNKIINGDFRINQRGFTSNTTSQTFGFDRWYHEFSGGTCTYTPQSFTVGSPVLQGYEASQFARLVNSSQSAASHYYLLGQKIEDVRNGDGVTLTVSFYAKAGSGTPSVAVELEQNFGSGGSTRVLTHVGKTAISTSWARYIFTVALPSIAGKTIGTSSFLLLNLWVSAGSDFNSRTGSLGIQNGTFDFWGVQVEANNVPTPFEQRPIGTELALCQRYYWRTADDQSSGAVMVGQIESSGTFASVGTTNPSTMRSAPSATLGSGIRFYSSSTSTITPTIFSQRSTKTHGSLGLTISGGTGGQGCVVWNNPASNSFVEFNSEL